jgi:hypothetical protein
MVLILRKRRAYYHSAGRVADEWKILVKRKKGRLWRDEVAKFLMKNAERLAAVSVARSQQLT